MLMSRVRRMLEPGEWRVVWVEKSPMHYYQSGFLFVPFGKYEIQNVMRGQRQFVPDDVEFILAEAERIDAAKSQLHLVDGRVLSYDQLVIATGARIAPEEMPGLQGAGWQKDIFDFYSLQGALALEKKLANWRGGRLVVNVAEMPIKCPVAPLEFLCLADEFFRLRGMRDKVELVYATPLAEVFSKPAVVPVFTKVMKEKNILVESDFHAMEVEPEKRILRTFDKRELDYDLLVTIPTNMGYPVIAHSDLGDEFNFVPTSPRTLQAKDWENIWVIGDTADLASPKTASAIHSMARTVAANIQLLDHGKALKDTFEGMTRCFVSVGKGKSIFMKFSYHEEPSHGLYPLPILGPFSMLKPTRINHLAKMSLSWVYWSFFLSNIFAPNTTYLPE